jgi:threonyl-tRNA synthetase
VQAIVLPIADRHAAYGGTVVSRLRAAGVRAKLDERTESISRKIRDAELGKVPYQLVVGEREVQERHVSLRQHRAGDRGATSVDQVLEELVTKVKNRSID